MKHISYIILMLCVFAFSCEKANSLLKEVEEQEQTDIEDLGDETEDKYMLPEQLPIPNEGKFWKYQDKFSNEFSSDKSSAEFTTNWQDKFFNGWRGPDKTRYTPSRSAISNGELIYEAAIINGTVETGCISSKEMVKYLYIWRFGQK